MALAGSSPIREYTPRVAAMIHVTEIQAAERPSRIALRQQHEHGNAGSCHRKEGLPDPHDDIGFVAHVNAPLTDLFRTLNTVRRLSMHNKRSICPSVKVWLTRVVRLAGHFLVVRIWNPGFLDSRNTATRFCLLSCFWNPSAFPFPRHSRS